MPDSILPTKEKKPGRVRSLWVADEIWEKVEAAGRESGNSTSATAVFLLKAALEALTIEKEKRRLAELQQKFADTKAGKP